MMKGLAALLRYQCLEECSETPAVQGALRAVFEEVPTKPTATELQLALDMISH